MSHDERGLLETIESWIVSQNRTQDNSSDQLNIQNVRHNMDLLKKILKEKQILIEDFIKSVLKSNTTSFKRLSKKEFSNQLTKNEKICYNIVCKWLTEKRESTSTCFIESSAHSNYQCSSKILLKSSNSNKTHQLHIRSNPSKQFSNEILKGIPETVVCVGIHLGPKSKGECLG